MWEDLTVALCCIGFAGAVTLMIAELPAVLDWRRNQFVHQRGHL